jgi:hypothetical protein
MNLAVCNACVGDIDAGIVALSTSLAAGFVDFDGLQANPFLEPLSAHPDYFKLLVK